MPIRLRPNRSTKGLTIRSPIMTTSPIASAPPTPNFFNSLDSIFILLVQRYG